MVTSIALLGCERGCLSKRLANTGDVELPLDLVDCPDGLARCVDGQLRKSKVAAVPANAACPWEPAGVCPGVCVEGVVVAAEHAGQLCRPEAGAWREQRAAFGECQDARWECNASRVVGCDAKQIVAVCTQGCAVDGLDDDLSEGDAVTILCRR
jgi:hypothetical protein